MVRKVIARESPVEFRGEYFTIPAEGGSGLGKPLHVNIRPRRPEVPIYLGAQGPENVALAAEIADGWLVLFSGPQLDAYYRAALAEGFGRPGARHTAESFTVVANVNVSFEDMASPATLRTLAELMA